VKVRAEVSGGQALLDDLQRLGKRGAEIGVSVLGAKTAEIVKRAKPLVPVDDVEGGDLRDSVRASKPQRTNAGRISAGVVAGGSSLRRLASERGRKDPGAYGVIQHEDLTLQHPGGGQAKFLEQPFLEVAPSVPDALREAMDRG
jgi:hypothetical protein